MTDTPETPAERVLRDLAERLEAATDAAAAESASAQQLVLVTETRIARLQTRGEPTPSKED
ncbi:hypothetical protein [Methylobacterium sp. JK268]